MFKKEVLSLLVLILFLSACFSPDADTKTDIAEKSEHTDAVISVVSGDTTAFCSTYIGYSEFVNPDSICVYQLYNSAIEEAVAEDMSLFMKDSTNFQAYASESEGGLVKFVLRDEILFNGADILSVRKQTFVDLLGAHGNTTFQFFNYDKQSCKPLVIADIIDFSKPHADSLLNNCLTKFAAPVLTSADSSPTADATFTHFGLVEEGVMFLYEAYELGGNVNQHIQFVVTYSALRDAGILKDILLVSHEQSAPLA